MRKILLGTTALVSAAVMASSAFADGHVKLSAFQRVYFHNVDESFTNITPAPSQEQDLFLDTGGSNSELHWTFTQEDANLTYGARFDTRLAGPGTDEVYLFFSGDWGLIHFGQDDDVTTNMVPGGENVLSGRGGYDGAHNNHTSTVAGLEGVNLLALDAPDPIGGGGDGTKIAYYSNVNNGFQVGLSYEPGSDSTTGSSSSVRSNSYSDVFGIAVTYAGSAEGMDFSIGAGHLGGDNDSNGHEDLQFSQIGATLSSSGISLGLGYGTNNDSGLSSSGAAHNTDGDAGEYWNIGLAYNHGNGSVSIGYHSGEVDIGRVSATDTNSYSIESDVQSIGADYSIAPGLTAFGEVNIIDSDGTTAGGSISQKVTAVILGTKASF